MDNLERSESRVYYAEYHSEILGPLFIAITDEGGYCIEFDQDSAAFITHLAQLLPPDPPPSILHYPDKAAPYCTALKNYFTDKTPISPDLPLDLNDLTDFQQEILQFVRNIPFGATMTYGEIAESIGNPNASRAIGQVLRRNPIPIFIPCHRVLNADGTLGGYGGVMGSERKIALLKHEGIIFA